MLILFYSVLRLGFIILVLLVNKLNVHELFKTENFPPRRKGLTRIKKHKNSSLVIG